MFRRSVPLKISQNSLEKNCSGVSFYQVDCLKACNITAMRCIMYLVMEITSDFHFLNCYYDSLNEKEDDLCTFIICKDYQP